MPNYKQLLVSLNIFKMLKLKRRTRNCVGRYTKQNIINICEMLAVVIDVEFSPYKKYPAIEAAPASEVESVESKKHIFWQWRPLGNT